MSDSSPTAEAKASGHAAPTTAPLGNSETSTAEAPLEASPEGPLVDGRCSTCTGLTYFSYALAQAKQPPVCLGFPQNHNVPPPPFTFPHEIEQAAKRQIPPGEELAYFVSMG